MESIAWSRKVRYTCTRHWPMGGVHFRIRYVCRRIHKRNHCTAVVGAHRQQHFQQGCRNQERRRGGRFYRTFQMDCLRCFDCGCGSRLFADKPCAGDYCRPGVQRIDSAFREHVFVYGGKRRLDYGQGSSQQLGIKRADDICNLGYMDAGTFKRGESHAQRNQQVGIAQSTRYAFLCFEQPYGVCNHRNYQLSNHQKAYQVAESSRVGEQLFHCKIVTLWIFHLVTKS